ncbi:RNA-guided endonuclease InsQ/TnpB family protein [Ktedonospora formicarum]|uniref:Transposase n=1 Tax=Ktedonospora formicarum TaxID=2778364 RepID=A0A8J3I5P9_9CHLR|nr:RNA-guided endonuclease TnpB family protein [Ktedonospora formicarum]GHO50807.1 transposase [Ktedonospora formicarum]
MTRGYRVELDLNNTQRTLCHKHAGAARWAYNYGLRRKQEAYKAGLNVPTAIDLHREINALKASEPWMYQVSKCAFQEGLRDLDTAFKHFFRKCRLKKAGTWKGKCGYPCFKSRKKAIGGARFTGSIRVSPDAIQLPRLGLLRLKEHNYLPMNITVKSATLSEKAGRWYVSLAVPSEQDDPAPATGPVIGVDLGIKTLAVTSDGRAFANPKALRKKIAALRRASRRHSRTHKGSHNRKKAAQRLRKLHARIAHVRQDALQKVTSTLVARTKPESERPACIVLEDLNISGMLKNRTLSRAIADVGMYEFRRQIEYKAASVGVRVVIVSRWEPSSKTCSCCGTVRETLGLNERVFVCEDCGYVADRDSNAAKNLARLAEHENYRELHGK